MKISKANPFNDVHGDGDIYEWVAPKGTKLHDAIGKMEAELGVKLMVRLPGDVPHGFVCSEDLEDGVYITAHLYSAVCTDKQCPGRHTGDLGKAAVPSKAALDRALAAVGEHLTLKVK